MFLNFFKEIFIFLFLVKDTHFCPFLAEIRATYSNPDNES